MLSFFPLHFSKALCGFFPRQPPVSFPSLFLSFCSSPLPSRDASSRQLLSQTSPLPSARATNHVSQREMRASSTLSSVMVSQRVRWPQASEWANSQGCICGGVDARKYGERRVEKGRGTVDRALAQFAPSSSGVLTPVICLLTRLWSSLECIRPNPSAQAPLLTVRLILASNRRTRQEGLAMSVRNTSPDRADCVHVQGSGAEYPRLPYGWHPSKARCD